MSHQVTPRQAMDSALRAVEIEAGQRWPGSAERGQFRVLAQFLYSWGDANISRDEAMLRLRQHQERQA